MALEDVLVAIRAPGGGVPVGAGLLVERDLVLTCAHVVNEALGRARLGPDRPPEGARVSVKLHAPAARDVTASVDAGDDAWSAPPPERQPGADLCLLRLDAEPGGDFKPVPLRVYGDDRLPIAFRAIGFPKDWDVDFAVGDIVGREGHGLYVLRPTRRPSPWSTL